jgi:aryl carrier-like protein
MEALGHGTGPGAVHGNEVLRRMRGKRAEAAFPVAVSAALEPAEVDASQLLEVLGRTEYAVSQTPQVLVDVQLFCVEGRLEVVLDTDESRVESVWANRVFAEFTSGVDALALEPALRGSSRPGDLDEIVRRDVEAVFGALIGGGLAADTSWFDLGATSLTLVTAHRDLRARGYDVDIVDMFAHPTPATTVAHLIGLRQQAATSEPVTSVASAVAPPVEHPAVPARDVAAVPAAPSTTVVEHRIPAQPSRGARRRGARRTRLGK